MATKSSTSANVLVEGSALHKELMAWSKDMYTAVLKQDLYAQQHDNLFQEFDRLRDETGRFTATTTLINHLAPIYNHCASQGYQAQIHYQPLRTAVFNWCKNVPVVHWQGPPDQFSPSVSPVIPPTVPVVTEPTVPTPTIALPPPTQASRPGYSTPCITVNHKPGPSRLPADSSESAPKPSGPIKPPVKSGQANSDSKGKGRQTGKGGQGKNISEEVVHEDDDNNEDEIEENEEAGPALPPTGGLERHLTKCQTCDRRNHGCHINPKAANNPLAACFECNHWKVRCSKCPGRSTDKPDSQTLPSTSLGGAAPLEVAKARVLAKAETETGGIPPKKPRTARKKPIAVPMGEAGEYAGLAAGIPANIVEKLAEYESARRADHEALAELSQKVARLEAENRSMRDWFSDRLLSLWENTKGRDVGVMQVLQNMHTLLVEESSRQSRLQQTAETLESLLKAPSIPSLDAGPAHSLTDSVAAPSSSTPAAVPASTALPAPTTNIMPTDTTLPAFPGDSAEDEEEDVQEAETSKKPTSKRPGSELPRAGGKSKWQKH